MSNGKCKCGNQCHPVYGNRCEDCWADDNNDASTGWGPRVRGVSDEYPTGSPKLPGHVPVNPRKNRGRSVNG